MDNPKWLRDGTTIYRLNAKQENEVYLSIQAQPRDIGKETRIAEEFLEAVNQHAALLKANEELITLLGNIVAGDFLYGQYFTDAKAILSTHSRGKE